MELVSRYTPSVYLFGFLVSLIISVVLSGFLGLAFVFGHKSSLPFTPWTIYLGFVNISFYITTAISAVIGSYIILATAVQMAMIDFWPEHVNKEDEERRRLLRGILLTFFCVTMALASWAITRSAVNVESGSPLLSEFFLAPLLVGLLFYAVALTQWPLAARVVR